MARSCFILGCGRSGTSLMAGLLAQAGYFMGDELYPPDDGNPKGYFEAREVNAINEGLLAQLLPGPRRSVVDKLMRRVSQPPGWYRWLAELDPSQEVVVNERLAARIRAQVASHPFCFKDPRFSYTLHAWRTFAPNAALICVFRDPAAAAESIVREAARTGIRLDGLEITAERALRIWRSAYRYILDVHVPAGGDWLFANYEQLIDGAAHGALGALLETKIDARFADPKLRRSKPRSTIAPQDQQLYAQLCKLAGFDPSTS